MFFFFPSCPEVVWGGVQVTGYLFGVEAKFLDVIGLGLEHGDGFFTMEDP